MKVQTDLENDSHYDLMSKVPQVTLMFWLIKILATTVGETGGDAVSMTFQLGYAVASLIFLVFFAVTLAIQVSTRRYHPFAYWAVVVATTTVGTTMSDFLDRTAGLGYIWSSVILFCAVLAILVTWHFVFGQIEYKCITKRKDEVFYWVTILVSNTLGTALGDCVADDTGLGFTGGAMVFAGLIAVVAGIYFFSKKIPTAILFWSAYILTRPLGATLGDTLTKPVAHGGLSLSRVASSLVIMALMVVGIFFMSRNGEKCEDETLAEPG